MANSEDYDQTAHPRSLIRVFTFQQTIYLQSQKLTRMRSLEAESLLFAHYVWHLLVWNICGLFTYLYFKNVRHLLCSFHFKAQNNIACRCLKDERKIRRRREMGKDVK